MPIAEAADLVPAFAHALWRQTERAIHQGLLPGYVVVEETSQVLRGRLRESEQLHRHHGLPFPLEIRHDEFTVDIAENRILRTACERMLAVPGVDAQSQRMLRRLLRDFADVTPLARREPVPAWQPTRLNARYHSALRLAELVLRATSVEHGPGGVAVNGFLFDMPKLFEEFVTVALREALVPAYGGRVVDQDRNRFDEARQVTLRPDIVWSTRDPSRRRRRQVQVRETSRLSERRPVPDARLLHGARASQRPPRLRQRQRGTRPPHRSPLRHRDLLPRP